MTYRVYILDNPAGRRYIGLSEDVEARLLQHNNGESRYTKGRGPWSLIWTSQSLSLSAAMTPTTWPHVRLQTMEVKGSL